MHKYISLLAEQIRTTIHEKFMEKIDPCQDIMSQIDNLSLWNLGQMDLLYENFQNTVLDDDDLMQHQPIIKALDNPTNYPNLGELCWNNLDNNYQFTDNDIGTEEIHRLLDDICQDLTK